METKKDILHVENRFVFSQVRCNFPTATVHRSNQSYHRKPQAHPILEARCRSHHLHPLSHKNTYEVTCVLSLMHTNIFTKEDRSKD